jgi:hypothetical protein
MKSRTINGRERKKGARIIIILLLVLGLTETAKSSIVDISVSTDKATYSLDEDVVVSITACNPNSEPVTLTGGFYFASYIMDDVYDWVEGRSAPQVIQKLTIDPGDSITWDLTHGSYEMQEYPLTLGKHMVVGEVLAIELIGDGKSAPVEFDVVPEPATILLLTLGICGMRIVRHRQRM